MFTVSLVVDEGELPIPLKVLCNQDIVESQVSMNNTAIVQFSNLCCKDFKEALANIRRLGSHNPAPAIKHSLAWQFSG